MSNGQIEVIILHIRHAKQTRRACLLLHEMYTLFYLPYGACRRIKLEEVPTNSWQFASHNTKVLDYKRHLFRAHQTLQ
jgi:hypothetical protein